MIGFFSLLIKKYYSVTFSAIKSRHTMVGSGRVIITFNWDNPYGY